jgi:hypothetical protein
MKALADESGVSVQTLLSRKHKAVLYLRTRLRDIYDALTGVRSWEEGAVGYDDAGVFRIIIRCLIRSEVKVSLINRRNTDKVNP